VVGAVGTTPIWASTSLDGNTLYVLNRGSDNISVVDAVGQTVNPTPIATGTTPSVIITDRSLNRLYVSNTGNNTVSVLDASSSALPVLRIVSAGMGTAPVSLAVTPDGASVYVANTGSNFVSVINASSFNVTSLTPDPLGTVQAVAVSKDGTKAFIAVTVASDRANASSTNLNNPASNLPTSGNGVYVVLTSTNAFVTNESVAQINIAPPQDLSCDATDSCFVPGVGSVLLQRPVQIVPRM
jgi:YVTN family beta-propeller protein